MLSLRYYATRISSLKELCAVTDSVNYNLEMVLTNTKIPGCCYRSSRNLEDPKNGIGRSGCPKPPFIGSSHDKRWWWKILPVTETSPGECALRVPAMGLCPRRGINSSGQVQWAWQELPSELPLRVIGQGWCWGDPVEVWWLKCVGFRTRLPGFKSWLH